jgi:putative hydrolase of the HAD superfamily
VQTAILFDFDGTLATYRGNFPRLILSIPKALELPEDDHEPFGDELVQQIFLDKPLTLRSAMIDALHALGYRIPANLDEVVEKALEGYSREIELLPGADALLERASKAMPLALVTNGPSDMQRRAVAAAGIEPYFKAIVISGDEDVGVRKPNPAIFRLACARLGVSPERAMMIGDNLQADIEGALAAGMQAIEVGPEVDLSELFEVIAAHLKDA